MRLRKDDDAEGFWPWGSDGDEGSEPVGPGPRGPGPDGGRVGAALPPRRPPSESVLPSPRHRASVDRRTAGSPNRLRRGKAWGAPDRRAATGPSGPGGQAPAPGPSAGPATGQRAKAPSAPAPRREQSRRTKMSTAMGSRRQDVALLLLAVVVAALVAVALLG